MRRYVITADGEIIGHKETYEKAVIESYKYEHECINQDTPYHPKMEIFIQELIDDDNEI